MPASSHLTTMLQWYKFIFVTLPLYFTLFNFDNFSTDTKTKHEDTRTSFIFLNPKSSLLFYVAIVCFCKCHIYIVVRKWTNHILKCNLSKQQSILQLRISNIKVIKIANITKIFVVQQYLTFKHWNKKKSEKYIFLSQSANNKFTKKFEPFQTYYEVK